MSAILQMYGNHNLKFDTYESGIAEVEKVLNIKIHRHSAGVQLLEKSGDFENLQFIEWPHFSNGKIDQDSIWLRINFSQCECLRIFKHGFDLFLISKINKRYNIWKTLVCKGFLKDPEMKEHLNSWNSQYSDWINLKTFAEHVSKKLGGTQFVYLNDYSFQDFGPELQFGMTFEKALEINKGVSEPLDYNVLLKDGDRQEDLKDWYIEQLDFND